MPVPAQRSGESPDEDIGPPFIYCPGCLRDPHPIMYDGLGLTLDENATDDVFTFDVFTGQSVTVGDPTK